MAINTVLYPTTYPYRAVVELRVTFSEMGDFVGSGVMIGPNDVLTASHMFDHPEWGYLTNVVVTPGMSPYGNPYGTAGWSTIDFHHVGNTVSEQFIAGDYAVIGLDRAMGTTTGWFGMRPLNPDLGTVVTGYPVAAGGRTMVTATGYGDYMTPDIIGYTGYISPGSSGGPVWQTVAGGPYVVGVVSAGPINNTAVGYGPAITSASVSEIMGWAGNNGNGTSGRTVSTAGADNMVLTDSTERVFAGGGDDTIRGGGGNDLLYGQQGNDLQFGDDGNDLMDAGLGNDTLFGGEGADVLGGAGGADLIDAGNGNDYVLSGDDNDLIFGGEGDDALRGQPGDDTIEGGGGNDRIWGDKGVNVLIGGTGADSFNVFPGAGSAVVNDFNRGEGDRIGYEPGMTWTIRDGGGGNTLVDFGNGTQVILMGIAPGAVTGDWFGII